MGQNKLTVYSNGLTRVQRYAEVEGKTTITIPVRKAYIADVIATLGVYGKVKVVEPPSYSNDASNKNGLKVTPTNIQYELATKLAGADVKVSQLQKTVTGKLAGVQIQESNVNGVVVKTTHFIVLTEGKLLSFTENSPTAGKVEIEFTQPEVQRLIATALAKNFELIRPDSVLVKLTVEPVDGVKTEVLIDYATPTAAWQSVYKLKLGDKPTLEYNAKLDNPTDEDWLGSKVSVVVGDPITFDTDLGEIRTPTRAKVNLIDNKATGPVRSVEAVRRSPTRAYAATAKGMNRGMAESALLCAAGPMGGGGFESMSELESVGSSYAMDDAADFQAQTGGASAEEVGDFAIFTSDDIVDVRANLSGVVRLFTEDVEAKEVLFFDRQQDADRAYRGVRLTNTTGKSLGKGMLTVYQGDVLAGQAVLENCKPGKGKTVVFARENGVEVVSKPHGTKSTRIAVSVKKGKLWWQDRYVATTGYNFDNLRKDEAFDLEINHTFTGGLDEPQVTVTEGVTVEQTKTGAKLTAKLAADGTTGFVVTETKVSSGEWLIEGENGLGRLHHFLSNDAETLERVKDLPAYKALDKLFDELTTLNSKIETLETEAETQKAEQKRLLELVKAGSSASQLDKWQTNLDKTEDRISTIEKKEIVDLQKKAADKEKALDAALEAFVFEWTKE